MKPTIYWTIRGNSSKRGECKDQERAQHPTDRCKQAKAVPLDAEEGNVKIKGHQSILKSELERTGQREQLLFS
jgi:hypothetical protein